MIDLFNLKSKSRQDYQQLWSGLLEQAKYSMPEQVPPLSRKHARYFIEDWLRLYEQSDEQARIGLAVFAYRTETHRYAAGMLIDGNPLNRISGIRILGYMRDESAWPVLVRLVHRGDKTASLAALAALLQINERRAKDEMHEQLRTRPEFSKDKLHPYLENIVGKGFSIDW